MEQYLDRVEELHERVIADHRTTGPSPSADSAIALARHIEHWGPHEPVAAALTRDRLRLLESLLHVRTGLGVVERGGTCEFGLDGDHAWLGLYGFSNPEERGVWSVGRDAMLLLNADLVGDVVLSWRVRSQVHQQNPILQCNVFVNGRACGDWTFSYPDDRGAVTRTLNFTANARDRMAFFIRFALSEVVSPSELGVSADARSLGIWLEAVTVQPAPSNAPTQRVF